VTIDATTATLAAPCNRRAGEDRRQCHPLFADWRWAFCGRRRKVRRQSDYLAGRVVLDWYQPKLFFFILSTYVLSGVDAALTLTLLNHGITVEANPFMDMLISKDVELFVAVKSLLTGAGLIGLTIYSNLRLFKYIPIHRIIYGLFAIYVTLVIYEVVLLHTAVV